MLVALLTIRPKDYVKGHRKTSAVKKQEIHSQEISRKIFGHSFHPLDALFNTGKRMLCADGHMWQ